MTEEEYAQGDWIGQRVQVLCAGCRIGCTTWNTLYGIAAQDNASLGNIRISGTYPDSHGAAGEMFIIGCPRRQIRMAEPPLVVDPTQQPHYNRLMGRVYEYGEELD